MGTRADFYVGRGTTAEWLGSIAWDGYPDGITSEKHTGSFFQVESEEQWRGRVSAFLAMRDDGTLPEMGWPWPWEDSRTTDYAYAYDAGQVYASCFGHAWFDPREAESDCDHDPTKMGADAFPNMQNRKNVTYGSRSGVMIANASGVVDPKDIDAHEAQKEV